MSASDKLIFLNGSTRRRLQREEKQRSTEREEKYRKLKRLGVSCAKYIFLEREKKKKKKKRQRTTFAAMEWWERILYSIRRVCTGVAFCFGVRRKGGLLNLHRDVSSCDYKDVHVMWDMLIKTEDLGHTPRRGKIRCFYKICGWARSAPFLCRNF